MALAGSRRAGRPVARLRPAVRRGGSAGGGVAVPRWKSGGGTRPIRRVSRPPPPGDRLRALAGTADAGPPGRVRQHPGRGVAAGERRVVRPSAGLQRQSDRAERRVANAGAVLAGGDPGPGTDRPPGRRGRGGEVPPGGRLRAPRGGRGGDRSPGARIRRHGGDSLRARGRGASRCAGGAGTGRGRPRMAGRGRSPACPSCGSGSPSSPSTGDPGRPPGGMAGVRGSRPSCSLRSPPSSRSW